jgi:dGTPase
MTARAHDTIRFLFESLTSDYSRMPEEHAANARKLAEHGDEAGAARVVADYIAGMTDRFALQMRDALPSPG